MTDTANLGLPCIEGSQAQKHVTHNDALRILDTLVQLAVLDRDLTAPPGAPVDGQSWIVKSGATGAWAGHDDAIASWQDGAWQFSVPRIGWLAYVVDESALLAWDGEAWVSAIEAVTPTALNNMTLIGLGTTADTTNPFSAMLNNALFAARTVAEGGDGHLRYKLSKESAAKTLSFLFQDNYSGRAEIGLTGDDDFRFKVSPDGSTWRDAIVIDKSTGQVSFPQGGTSTDLELTLAELTLGVADALNTAQFFGSAGNRFADSFDALTYVDTGAATNLDSATAGLLKPSAPPATTGTWGTSASATRAMGASGGAIHGGFQFTAAANGSLATVKLYVITVTAAGNLTVKLYSNNAGNPGTQIGSSSGAVNVTSTGEKTWTFASPPSVVSGTAYWIVIENSGSVDVEFQTIANNVSYGSGRNNTITAITTTGLPSSEDWRVEIAYVVTANNLTVASTAVTAASAPSTAKLVARIKEVDAITLNTDLVFYASRDGGTTYTAFAMTKKFTASSIAVYESAQLDISGQPTGTSVKWKAASANNKNFEIHDVYLYWS